MTDTAGSLDQDVCDGLGADSIVDLTYDLFETRVRDVLDGLGISPPVIPKSQTLRPVIPPRAGGRAGERLQWPEDLGALHKETLGLWMGHLAGWVHYAKSQNSQAMAVRAEVEHWIDRTIHRHMAVTTGGKVTDRRNQANSLPIVLRLREVELEARVRTRTLAGEVSGLEGRYQAVSREVSSRQVHGRVAGAFNGSNGG